MSKAITISDDVYKELLRIKEKRSFSEVIGGPPKRKER